MSTFRHIIRIPAGRRTYSYFSSRSGGGRFFNSAKPPKAPVVTAKPTNSTSPKPEPPTESNQTGVKCASQPPSNISAPSGESASSSQTNAVGSSGSESSGNGDVPHSNQDANSDDSRQLHIPTPTIITAKDFKMHQFFSLHRPLLLISQPSSLFRNLPFNHAIFSPLPPSEAEIQNRVIQAISAGDPSLGATGPTDAFMVDADAETARLLSRALTMTKAGATVSWEETLKTLGLDVAKEAERADLQQQFEKDWEDVRMDSTKRKRRKKMKKHK